MIQTLRAFRRPNFGGLDAWRVGENQPKMEPWAAPNGARMEDKQNQNTKTCSLAPKMLQGWFQEGSQPERLAPNHRFLGPLGDPKSTENRPVDLQSAAGLVF